MDTITITSIYKKITIRHNIDHYHYSSTATLNIITILSEYFSGITSALPNKLSLAENIFADIICDNLSGPLPIAYGIKPLSRKQNHIISS